MVNTTDRSSLRPNTHQHLSLTQQQPPSFSPLKIQQPLPIVPTNSRTLHLPPPSLPSPSQPINLSKSTNRQPESTDRIQSKCISRSVSNPYKSPRPTQSQHKTRRVETAERFDSLKGWISVISTGRIERGGKERTGAVCRGDTGSRG